MANQNQDGETPVVIRKKKEEVHEGGHHGGAWKIAYADFVTAMMCVFLVLWLINVTDKETREGIADHFSPLSTQTDASSSSQSFFEGESTQSVSGENKAGGENTVSPPMSQPSLDGPRKQTTTAPDEVAEQFAEKLEARLSEMGIQNLRENIRVTQTRQGLRIQIVDDEDFSMFAPATARITNEGLRVLGAVDRVVKLMPQDIVVTGHTDARPYTGDAFTDNWSLSAVRANRAKIAMASDGITSERFERIQGKAAERLLRPDEPNAPQNRRISILLLFDSAEGAAADATGEDAPRQYDWLNATEE